MLPQHGNCGAYVGVDAIELDCPSWTIPREQYVPQVPAPGLLYKDFVRVKMRNYGKTPAYHTEIWGGWAGVRPFPAMLPPNYPFAVGNDTKVSTSRQILHQNQMTTPKIAIPDISFLHRAVGQEESVFFFGRIDYEDAFKRRWRTHFCYVYEHWQPHGQRFVAFERNNYEEQID